TLADDLGQHLRAAQLLLKLALVAAHRQHIRELQRAIVLALLNPQRVAGSHAVLLAAGTNDCVHNSNLSRGRTHALPQKISLDKLFALSIDALVSGGACHASSGPRCQPFGIFRLRPLPNQPQQPGTPHKTGIPATSPNLLSLPENPARNQLRPDSRAVGCRG